MTLVKDDKNIGGRWSNYNTALVEDWEVVFAYLDGDYQGSCEFIAKQVDYPGNEYVLADWTWGSCSGCDGYEDMSEGERVKAFMDNRIYLNTETLEAWLTNYESVNSRTLEELFLDPQSYSYPRTALLKVNAIRAELEMPAYHP